ncbi:MAG: MBL fold metallo-hydrolase [Pseudomonadota bacterium]
MTDNYVRFWGVRGSYPAPFTTHMAYGGNTPCVEVRLGNELIIFDAGTGIIPLGNALMGQSEIRHIHIVLSHYHWDHIQGMPYFVPAFVPGWRISIYGPAENPEKLADQISQQMKAPYFPVEVETWLADISYHTPHNRPFDIGPATLQAFPVHHPGTTYGYRLEFNGRSVVYAPDNELQFISQSIDDRKAEFDEEEKALLEAMKEEQRLKGIHFMAGADMVIHDAQYTPEDYTRKRGWGHSCYIDTINSAIDANTDCLYLFSHDPNYNDLTLDEIAGRADTQVSERQAAMGCWLARENMTVSLDGERLNPIDCP